MQRGTPAGGGQGAHHLAAFHLGQIDRFCPIQNGEVYGFAAFLHGAVHIGARDGHDIPISQKACSGDKGLNPGEP